MKNKKLLKGKIHEAVCGMYSEVALKPKAGFHFPTGRDALLAVGYPANVLRGLPLSAQESFAGVGYHFQNDLIKSGDNVLDIGSGSGTDILIASRLVGDEGRVVGIDITDEMLSKARKSARQAGLKNIELIKADAEKLPFKAETFDVVISNGVINLAPNKKKVFQEIFRVLKPGGYLSLADIVLHKPISEKSRANPDLWASCIVGAVEEHEYLRFMRESGFAKVKVVARLDYFAKSPIENTRKVAASYGAEAIVVMAQKPSKGRTKLNKT